MTLSIAPDLALVRTFASHPCGAGSNPRPSVICWPRGISIWVLRVSSFYFTLGHPENIRFPLDGMPVHIEVNPSASFCHVTITIRLYPFINLAEKRNCESTYLGQKHNTAPSSQVSNPETMEFEKKTRLYYFFFFLSFFWLIMKNNELETLLLIVPSSRKEKCISFRC